MKKLVDLNKFDQKFLKRNARIKYFIAAFFIIVYIIYFSTNDIIGDFIIGIMCVGIYVAFMWPFRYFGRDLKKNQKTLHKSGIEKIRRLGIFDPEGVSIASRMLGAAFYLWVKDEDQEYGLLRLRVVKRVYEGLKNRTNDNITLTYLTKGSFVMSVETDDFTWHAYDQSSWAKKYLEEEQATGTQSNSDKQAEDESPKE